MNREDMMLAFRMIAMGRPAVPQVEALVDYLLGLVPAVTLAEAAPAVLEVEIPGLPVFPTSKEVEAHKEAVEAAPKRGRKPKAD